MTRAARAPEELLAEALRAARSERVGVYLLDRGGDVAEALQRMPRELREVLAALVVVGADPGGGVPRATRPPVEVLTSPFQDRYGAQLKLALVDALGRGLDQIALLHVEGRSGAEDLPALLAALAPPDVAAVIGTAAGNGAPAAGGERAPRRARLERSLARGLSAVQNRLLGSRVPDFHSSLRAYRLDALRDLPFRRAADDPSFETEILIQLWIAGSQPVTVPGRGAPPCALLSLPGLRYAVACLRATLRAVANRFHLVYHPTFDLEGPGRGYRYKQAPSSLHQHVLRRASRPGARIADLGAGGGALTAALHREGARVVAVDEAEPEGVRDFPYLVQRLEDPFAERVQRTLGAPAEIVLALDVIEHLAEPERALTEMRRLLVPGGRLVASTANVAYLPVRLSLLLGQFNYGKRGILDVTHRRLFTIRTFRRLLRLEDFQVESVRGFGPPIRDVIGDGPVLRLLDRVAAWLARLWPSLFAYQFLVEARRLPCVDDLAEHPAARRVDEPAEDPSAHRGGADGAGS